MATKPGGKKSPHRGRERVNAPFLPRRSFPLHTSSFSFRSGPFLLLNERQTSGERPRSRSRIIKRESRRAVPFVSLILRAKEEEVLTSCVNLKLENLHLYYSFIFSIASVRILNYLIVEHIMYEKSIQVSCLYRKL